MPQIEVIDEHSKMNANAGAYAGLDRFAARARIVEDLSAQGFLVETKDYTIAIGKCDRSGTIVEPRLSTQWFIVPDFIAAVKKLNDALNKQADWPKTSGWLQLVNGGEGPTFVLLNSRKNWADFAPLPKTTADVLNEAYGKEVSTLLALAAVRMGGESVAGSASG